MASLITIERHIVDQQRLHPTASGTLSAILYDIALAAKIIARETSLAGLANLLGSAETANIHGEIQQKLDLYADQTIFRLCDHTGRLCVMASEEHDDLIPIPDQYPCGKYVLLYDPLDGSANIDVNSTLGTIFAIYRKVSSGERGTLDDLLQPGRALVAAVYIIYGPSTMLVYSTGHGVHGFTLDPSVGEFLLSHENLRMPDTPIYYGVNQGHEKEWSTGVRAYLDWLQGMGEEPSRALDMRYGGCLVADFHRMLLKGGVYFYPGSKLRLTYEGAPLAFIAEQAGGYASDGTQSVLDMKPTTLHQRIPLFIGNRSLVEKAEEYIRRHEKVGQK